MERDFHQEMAHLLPQYEKSLDPLLVNARDVELQYLSNQEKHTKNMSYWGEYPNQTF